MTGIRKWMVSLPLLALAAAVMAALVRTGPRTPASPARDRFATPPPSVSGEAVRMVAEPAFHLFDSPTGSGELTVRYALPAAEPAGVRLGGEDRQDAASGRFGTFDADWMVLSRLIPRSGVEYVYKLPLLAGALADSSELISRVGRLLYSDSRAEGFSLFRPDATFDVNRVMPVITPPASGFSVGLKYRWLF